MEISQQKVFSQRKFISVSLFLTLVVSVLAAIVIQIFEVLKADFLLHLFTVIHIFTGLVFSVLSALHIIMNWQSMKSYCKSKDVTLSREVIYALLLTIISILVGVLFVCFIMD